jgi:hypothetical protein
MIKVLGTYNFTLVGDGIATEFVLHLAALKAPDPIKDDQLPTALRAVKQGGVVIDAMLDGEALYIKCKTPPTETGTKFTAEMLFGKD